MVMMQANVDNHVEDLATVTLEMERDLVGSLCIGRIGAASHPDIGEIKLHMLGSKGALVISEARPEVSIYYRGQPATEFRNRRIGIDNDFLLMDNFAHAIDSGGDTILDAAAGVLVRSGSEVSLQEIAEAAGLTRGALYRYFPSKEALSREVFARCFHLTKLAIDEAFQQPGSPVRALLSLIEMSALYDHTQRIEVDKDIAIRPYTQDDVEDLFPRIVSEKESLFMIDSIGKLTDVASLRPVFPKR